MESKAEKSVRKDGFEISAANGSGSDSLTDSGAEFRDSSTSSSSRSSSDASLAPLGWPIRKAHEVKSSISDVSLGDIKSHKDHPNLKKLGPKISATVFGQLWRLEPLPLEKKSMWQREMEWLLCVSDHIVELIPAWQTFPYGSKLECEDQRCHVLLRENTILKRAVAMQHERQKEYDDRNQERAQTAEGFH